jgi:energy-coupling factor transporter ATP-binding protein EcfA2
MGSNALPDGSAITFGEGLTVIYGRNAAGKSGFARLFANVCFSRHQPRILGNVHGEESSGPAASFHFRLGGQARAPYVYQGGASNPDLVRISFFDRVVADQHVSKETTFEFKPAGFDVFPELARVYGELGRRLEHDIATRRQPNEFAQSFLAPPTAISGLVAARTPRADNASRRPQGAHGTVETSRLAELDRQLAALRARDTRSLAQRLRETKASLGRLAGELRSLADHFALEQIERRNTLAVEAKAAEEGAVATGTDQFRRPFFRVVGGPEWEEFSRAAHALARAESPSYPQHSDRCLLCERPFDETSRAHVESLLAYVEGTARRRADSARTSVDEAVAVLQRLDIAAFDDTTRLFEQVTALEPDTATAITGHLETIGANRDACVSALRERRPAALSLVVSGADIAARIDALDARIDADIVRLSAEDQQRAIAELEVERQLLRHRQVLNQLLPSIERWLRDAKWCQTAERSRRAFNTRHVTEKQRQLFDEIVNDEYRERLRDECEALDCNMPIELQTTPRAGDTRRSFTISDGRHPPSEILSDGEQRGIALADFLAEVGVNPSAAGIVLDDPVTSLDLERRERIAARLVSEAQRRQVIVFTHDLVFVNQLYKAADDADIAYEAHRIERSADGRPGEVTLRDPVGTSKFYDTTERAKQYVREAHEATGAARDDAIRKGMGALRRTIEETIAKRLFKGVVPRWEDRVIVTKLSTVNWDSALADDLCTTFEELSRHIEGHTHTEEAMGAPPDIAALETYVARVDSLVARARPERRRD